MRARGSNLSIVKQQNDMLIKEIIYREGPITRADISQRLGLTIPTITSNVNQMLQRGLLREFALVHNDTKQLGRRPSVVEINENAFYVMGIELGPYATSYIITNLNGAVLYSATFGQPQNSYQDLLHDLERDIPTILVQANLSPGRLLGIGIGLPGFVDGETGRAQNTFRKNWNGKNLAADLGNKLNIPIKVENNVRARAVCADLFDKLVVNDPFLYFFVSYGLACSLIINGKLLYGEAASAGEIGHMIVELNGPKCDTCGNHGCLEAIASEKAIVKRCQQLMSAGIPTMLDQLCDKPSDLKMEDIVYAQTCGDVTINGIIADCIKYLGTNLANIINLVSPRTVLLDGYLFTYSPNQSAMRDLIEQSIFCRQYRKLDIDFVEFDPFRGARGAAAIAVKEFFLNNNEFL